MLQKIRDLVEADEMEVQCDNAQEVMFLRYALEVPAIKPRCDFAAARSHRAAGFIAPINAIALGG